MSRLRRFVENNSYASLAPYKRDVQQQHDRGGAHHHEAVPLGASVRGGMKCNQLRSSG